MPLPCATPQPPASRRRHRLPASALSGLCLLLASACAQPPATLTDAHRTAIRDSVTTFLAAFNRHGAQAHFDSLGALYSTDPTFRFLESGGIQYTSAQAIRDALAAIPPGTRIENTHREVAIEPLAPGLASVTALFDTRFADASGNGFSFGGALSLLVRHDSTGWRIIGGHSSAPAPRGNR